METNTNYENTYPPMKHTLDSELTVKLVKEAFRKLESPCTCPRDFPVCMCGKKSLGTVITKKPIEPSEEEKEENPRARSAKLRVFERNGNEQYN